MFDRVTKGGKMDRNRGYIRVARELVKVVTAIWRNGTTYQEAPPARAGSGKAGKSSVARSPRKRMEKFFGSTRSGTGQRYHPMVPAVQA
jgi:hypothetical protein